MAFQRKRCPGQEDGGGPAADQDLIWEGASSLGVRAANSLYKLDATVDEGAAGWPEVQAGQAGHSGPSGLATGTENRREMNRVKRGKIRAVKVGRGRGVRGGSWQGEGPREPL